MFLYNNNNNKASLYYILKIKKPDSCYKKKKV